MSTIAFTACFAVWTVFSIIGVKIKQDLAAAMESRARIGLRASNGRLHPVCGLWSVSFESLLADYLAQGRSSLRDLAAAAGETVADWGTIQPDPFVNLNTLDELRAQQPRANGLTPVKATRAAISQTVV